MRLRSDLEHYAAAVRSTLRSHAEKSPIGIEDDAANGNAAIGVIGVEVVHNGFRPTSSQRWGQLVQVVTGTTAPIVATNTPHRRMVLLPRILCQSDFRLTVRSSRTRGGEGETIVQGILGVKIGFVNFRRNGKWSPNALHQAFKTNRSQSQSRNPGRPRPGRQRHKSFPREPV